MTFSRKTKKSALPEAGEQNRMGFSAGLIAAGALVLSVAPATAEAAIATAPEETVQEVSRTSTVAEVTTAYGEPVETFVLASRELPNTSLNGGVKVLKQSLKFPTINNPRTSAISPDRRTLTLVGEGTYQVNPALGSIMFFPQAGFSGKTSAITYQATTAEATPLRGKLSIQVEAKRESS